MRPLTQKPFLNRKDQKEGILEKLLEAINEQKEVTKKIIKSALSLNTNLKTLAPFITKKEEFERELDTLLQTIQKEEAIKANKKANPPKMYHITIPEDKTLEELTGEDYPNKDPDITSKNFPDLGPRGDFDLVPVHFNRVIRTRTAIAKIRCEGYEPAHIGQLVIFGKQYPNFPVACVASTGVTKRMVYLNHTDAGKNIELTPLCDEPEEYYWDSSFYFLAFIKKIDLPNNQ